MSPLDTLTEAVAKAPTLDSKIEKLLLGLAERIKATSNDQNIQKLARDLKAATPALGEALKAHEPA